MNRDELRRLWDEMSAEGNWIPSWPDSLRGLSAEDAAWKPDDTNTDAHSIWQEIVHVTFWRRVTLGAITNEPRPTDDEVNAREFAAPDPSSDGVTESAWAAAVAALEQSQRAIADELCDENSSLDLERVQYHLIHDAYHLGRITHLRALRGTPPPF